VIAGTLGVCDPVDEPLESWRDGDYLALQVSTSQTTHDETVAQRGTAAARIEQTEQDVIVTTDQSGDVVVDTSREDVTRPFATDLYADVVGAGVVLAESVGDPNETSPFPLDLVSVRAGSEVTRRALDIAGIHHDWDQAGDLHDVWMAGSDARAGTNMAYHGAAADADEPATIGLGFKRPWSGTLMKGVVYASGYVALYSARTPADGLGFVADEILPYTEPWDPDEHGDQADFDDFGGA
jgi:hypothetical protein